MRPPVCELRKKPHPIWATQVMLWATQVSVVDWGQGETQAAWRERQRWDKGEGTIGVYTTTA